MSSYQTDMAVSKGISVEEPHALILQGIPFMKVPDPSSTRAHIPCSRTVRLLYGADLKKCLAQHSTLAMSEEHHACFHYR